ncbi:MAG: hypothetical protein ABIG11_08420 [bacterium]
MTSLQATAAVFVAALKAMPSAVREQVVLEIIRDNRLREDMIDLAVAAKRARSRSRPLKKFLSGIAAGNLR